MEIPNNLDLEWLKALRVTGELGLDPPPSLHHLDPFQKASAQSAYSQKTYFLKRWIKGEGPIPEWLKAEESISQATSRSSRRKATQQSAELRLKAQAEWEEAYWYFSGIKPLPPAPKPRTPAFIGNW